MAPVRAGGRCGVFHQLTYNERYLIQQGRRMGASVRAIARGLGRSPSTVSRELRKGTCELIVRGRLRPVYDAYHAQEETERRAAKRGRSGLKIGSDRATAEALERLIAERGYSPYAAIAAASRAGELGTRICVSTLYAYIRDGVLGIGPEALPRGLKARRGKRFRDRRDAPEGRTGGRSISERPGSVLSRSEFGHWEGDLVVSGRRGRAAVLTLLERKTRMYLTALIPDRRQESVRAALDGMERTMGPLFRWIFKSVTWDNGVEFRDARALERSVSSSAGAGEVKRFGETYYAHPYCSGERGSNENANGLLRRFFPKGSRFDEVTDEALRAGTDWINSYPRRILGGRCARELFEDECARVAEAMAG